MIIAGKRIIYFILILITIPAGIASRKYGYFLPKLIADYSGDTLYAVCAFWTFRMIMIKIPLKQIAIITLLICTLIEILQLYQAEWIQSLRNTPPFGLLLGYGFLWTDLLCYTLGTLLALLMAWLIERK